jgi:hypothetical protein
VPLRGDADRGDRRARARGRRADLAACPRRGRGR